MKRACKKRYHPIPHEDVVDNYHFET